MVIQFFGNSSIDKFKAKNASYLLGGSVTQTALIDGLSQAGIPGYLHLTPTLDMEFVCDGIPYSLDGVAETPKGVPTPGITVRAIEELTPFAELVNLDLGLTDLPKCKNGELKEFDIPVSGDISKDCNINAKEIFEKGREYGRSFEPKGDYTILAESTPAGTTTAYATAEALGYRAEGLFSSSFKDAPSSLKRTVVDSALARIDKGADIWKILSTVSDNMLIFSAGFASTASLKNEVVLAGGTQMSACLCILDKLTSQGEIEFNEKNISLMTTRWVYEDENSDIGAILSQLKIDVSAFYSDFSFETSNHPALKLYDTGEAKEGVGLGAALCYADFNGVSNSQIIERVEELLA
jgi:uncharacterized protein (TIGR00303 family)